MRPDSLARKNLGPPLTWQLARSLSNNKELKEAYGRVFPVQAESEKVWVETAPKRWDGAFARCYRNPLGCRGEESNFPNSSQRLSG